MSFDVIQNLRRPAASFVALGVAVLFFDVNYYFMSTLPGYRSFACVPGANLNFTNMLFAVVLSLMAGLIAAGMFMLYQKRRARLMISSISGVGFVVGTMTVFCTACVLPVISLFGLSIGLTFFTIYNSSFKILSLLLMAGSLYLLNKQLADECEVCNVT